MPPQIFKSFALLGVSVTFAIVLSPQALTQVVSDSTVNTQVSATDSTWHIQGGITAGSNLFHSFDRFNVRLGETASFENAPTIANIFARVTGGASTINGTIAAQGTANLFLLNPNGLFFGSQTRLNLGGSFLASTADSLIFPDGVFSATQPSTAPLLTVNLPLGLQMGTHPGAIEVQGPGHNLVGINGFISILAGAPLSPQLAVSPGHSIALLGGAVNLTGGLLSAPQGHLELGGVSQDTVGLTFAADGIHFNYGNVQHFEDVRLTQQALGNVGGILPLDGSFPVPLFSGSIQMQGRTLYFQDGSVLLGQSLSPLPGGTIALNASTALEMSGTNSGFVHSGILNSTLGPGTGGNLSINTPLLRVTDGGGFGTFTTGSGQGGDLTLNTPSLFLDGSSSLTPLTPSAIATITTGTGTAGALHLTTDNLQITNGGLIISFSFGKGTGGDVTVQAHNSILLSGINSESLLPSGITSSGGGAGPAGKLNITTLNLTLLNGGRVAASTFGSGAASSVVVNAQNIRVSGTVPGSINPSLIDSSGSLLDGNPLQQLFGEITLRGSAGNLLINTDRLTIDHGGLVSVGNLGTGAAGTLNINANQIQIETQGGIAATTVSGEGGNVNLRANQQLSLRHGGKITTEAGGTGNGGDLTIITPFVIAPPQENSDIIANAFQGNGGNIRITATGILGSKFQPTLTPHSDIVASSTFGTSGTVTLNRPEVDVSSGLVTLPSQLGDPSTQVANHCAAKGNSFTIAGRGGLPENPTAIMRGQTLWQDPWQDPNASRQVTTSPLQEAQELHKDSNGNILLAVPQPPHPTALGQEGQRWFAQGQLRTAFETWQRAEQAYQQTGNQEGVWGSRLNQAQALQSLGEYHHADRLLSPLSTQINTITDPRLKSKLLRSWAVTLQAQGDWEQAKTFLEDSLHLSQAAGLTTEVAATLFALGNLVWEVQQPTVALDYYNAVLQNNPDPLLQVQTDLNTLSLLIDLHPQADFTDRISSVLQEISQLPPSRASIDAHLNLADRLLKLNASQPISSQPITSLLTTAITQAQTLGDDRSLAFALKQWGSLYQAQQQLPIALAVTQQSLVLAQRIQSPDIVALAAQQLGDLLKEDQHWEEATQAYSIAFTALQTLRSDLVAANTNVQFSLRDQVEPIYREYVSLLLRSDSQDNLSRARDVIEALQLSELDNFFGDACLPIHSVDIDQIDSHAAVLYPIILNDRLEVILSIPHRPLQRYQTELPAPTIKKTIRDLYSSFYPGYDREMRLQLSQQVYDWLIRPAESSLQAAEVKTLVFVLDGNLKSIPMAALYDGSHYLIERYGVAVSPGLQLLPPSERSLLSGVLVGGIAAARDGFPALPGVAREVAAITQTSMRKNSPEALLDEQFTHPALAHLLLDKPQSIVHLATHGQFSADPRQTFLLAWDDRINVQELGQLFQSRRLGLGQPLDLLVMSACQSATGDQRAVLGLAGMALQSGSRSTIASLWSVSDEATADLMTAFYHALYPSDPSDRPISKGEALRQAQLYMLHHPNPFYARNPYFWAGFVLVGNWL